ncbi:MAG: hypothetical protein LBS28_02095 [Streptococcaceae bacterium]|jgi:hypothetical protein|nr:hypothetical protein [Streptococcaceae bacterium]
MIVENLYIHLNATTQAVLGRGFSMIDFSHAINQYPQNLLLFDPNIDIGHYNRSTNLRMILGRENVASYFHDMRKKEKEEELKWIDFTDEIMLKELSPMELSELLYFSHMKKPLHSPFFYKLQNNFVYFEYGEDFSKIYYRYLDEFYRILANKLSRLSFTKINYRKFFSKKIIADKPSLPFLRKLKSIFEEGIIICFTMATIKQNKFSFPLYAQENVLWGTRNLEQKSDTLLLAHLIYDVKEKTWNVNMRN